MSPEEWHKTLKNVQVTSSMVDRPPHYNKSKIEAIEYIQDTLGEGFTYYLEGNIKKYLHRFRYKNGREDLKKAEWYLKKLIETYKD